MKFAVTSVVPQIVIINSFSIYLGWIRDIHAPFMEISFVELGSVAPTLQEWLKGRDARFPRVEAFTYEIKM